MDVPLCTGLKCISNTDEPELRVGHIYRSWHLIPVRRAPFRGPAVYLDGRAFRGDRFKSVYRVKAVTVRA